MGSVYCDLDSWSECELNQILIQSTEHQFWELEGKSHHRIIIFTPCLIRKHCFLVYYTSKYVIKLHKQSHNPEIRYSCPVGIWFLMHCTVGWGKAWCCLLYMSLYHTRKTFQHKSTITFTHKYRYMTCEGSHLGLTSLSSPSNTRRALKCQALLCMHKSWKQITSSIPKLRPFLFVFVLDYGRSGFLRVILKQVPPVWFFEYIFCTFIKLSLRQIMWLSVNKCNNTC